LVRWGVLLVDFAHHCQEAALAQLVLTHKLVYLALEKEHLTATHAV
jgi:hypothetical protein